MKIPYRISQFINKFIDKPSPERKIFFLHLPKCGGTSIINAIGECYGGSSALNKNQIMQLNIHALYKAAPVCGLAINDYLNSLLCYYMAMKPVKYISGHFNFSKEIYYKFGNEWDFVTILRHPVSRWFSHYFYNRYKTDDLFRIHEDLLSFVNSERGAKLGLLYANTLTGFKNEPFIKSDKTVYKAIENLSKFSLVGCLEYIDIFTDRFRSRYKIKLNIGSLNKNPLPKSNQDRQISAEVRKMVEKICEPDIEIYNYAKSRWIGNTSTYERK